VHASPSQPSDQESAGDQEFPSAPVGCLPPGSILEEMETLSGPLKKTDDSYHLILNLLRIIEACGAHLFNRFS